MSEFLHVFSLNVLSFSEQACVLGRAKLGGLCYLFRFLYLFSTKSSRDISWLLLRYDNRTWNSILLSVLGKKGFRNTGISGSRCTM